MLACSPEDSPGAYIRVQLRHIWPFIVGGRLGLLVREVGQIRSMRRRGCNGVAHGVHVSPMRLPPVPLPFGAHQLLIESCMSTSDPYWNLLAKAVLAMLLCEAKPRCRLLLCWQRSACATN